jgi:hypothetical protein
VRVLARRPVNLNTAPTEVLQALFLNLQVAGRNSRITGDEAQKLATLVLESRPFEGFEDFLRRIVLPAAGIEKLAADAPVVPAILAGLSAGRRLHRSRRRARADDEWPERERRRAPLLDDAVRVRDARRLRPRAARDGRRAERRRALLARAPGDGRRRAPATIARAVDAAGGLRRVAAARPRGAVVDDGTERDVALGQRLVPPSRLWAELGTAEGKVYLPGVTDMSSFKDRSSPPNVEHVFPSRQDTAFIHLWPSRVGASRTNSGA